jgi:hypothetical protein
MEGFARQLQALHCCPGIAIADAQCIANELGSNWLICSARQAAPLESGTWKCPG